MVKKKIKKITNIFLSFFLFVTIINAKEIDLNLKSEKYILYNLKDDTILLEKDSNIKTNVASLTKIMSTIVSIENTNDYDKDITITNDMIKGIASDVSKIGLKKGQIVKYNDLVAGSLIASGADAIQALSIYSNGSLKTTVDRMNSKVNELNLKNTNFTNVVGLYNENNYSSAYDMAQILKYSLKNEKFKQIFTSPTYTLSYGKTLKSTISRYNKKAKKDISYIKGSKTGYIKKAGYCLASIATINNVDYLLITLNAYNDSTAHLEDTINIYEYFSNNYDYIEIFAKGEKIYTLPIINSTEEDYIIEAPYTKTLFINKDFDKDKLVFKYTGKNEISYLDEKASKLGNIRVIYEDEELDNFDVFLNATLSFKLEKYITKYKKLILSILAIITLFIAAIITRHKVKISTN